MESPVLYSGRFITIEIDSERQAFCKSPEMVGVNVPLTYYCNVFFLQDDGSRTLLGDQGIQGLPELAKQELQMALNLLSDKE